MGVHLYGILLMVCGLSTALISILAVLLVAIMATVTLNQAKEILISSQDLLEAQEYVICADTFSLLPHRNILPDVVVVVNRQ